MVIYLQNVPNLYFRIEATVDHDGEFDASITALRGIRMNQSLLSKEIAKVFRSVNRGKEPVASQVPNTVDMLNIKLNVSIAKLHAAGKVELFDIASQDDVDLYNTSTGHYTPDGYITYSPYSCLRKPIPSFNESVH